MQDAIVPNTYIGDIATKAKTGQQNRQQLATTSCIKYLLKLMDGFTEPSGYQKNTGEARQLQSSRREAKLLSLALPITENIPTLLPIFGTQEARGPIPDKQCSSWCQILRCYI